MTLMSTSFTYKSGPPSDCEFCKPRWVRRHRDGCPARRLSQIIIVTKQFWRILTAGVSQRQLNRQILASMSVPTQLASIPVNCSLALCSKHEFIILNVKLYDCDYKCPYISTVRLFHLSNSLLITLIHVCTF